MRSRTPLFAAALLATLAACVDEPTGPSARKAGPGTQPLLSMNDTSARVVGYFPDWYNGSLDAIPYDKLTHVIYAFAQPTSTGGISFTGGTKLSGVVQRAHNAGAKVLISFGGWTGSDDSNFEPMAANATYRAAFVSNVTSFVSTYNLDGVDIDWEFPEAGTEAASFTALMDELATALHGNGKLLTAAVAVTDYYGKAVSSDVFADVDFLFLMAYARSTPPHASYAYAVEALDYWSMRGLPKNKTVLGVPFYGKNSSGVNQPYRTLVRNDAQAPNKDESNGYHYNGLATMEQKTTLSLQRGGGIGIWELTNDTTAAGISLLDAIQDGMNSPVPPYDYTRVVYDDSLAWADWSWNATRNLASTAYAYQGSRSIAVTYTAAWGGLQLYYGGGVNPATVSTVEFYIHGGTTGGQNLNVHVADANGSRTKLPVNSYVEGGSVAANAWRKVSVPISAMNVTNPIFKLIIQENAGTTPPTFYVDYIRFLP